jgi:hypothetical protein
MPVRQEMESLIGEVRGAIGDRAGETQTFADEEIQRALDRTLDGVAVENAAESDFDFWVACADLCESWAVRLKDDVDFKDGNREFKDSQKAENLRVHAGRFRQRSDRGVSVGSLTNSDFNS